MIHVRSVAPQSTCPRCERRSARVHSHYQRTLADLPCQGRRVQLCWDSRRFFCDDPACSQQIFTERLPTVAATYARHTARLATAWQHIAFACGGEGGARLAAKLGMDTSPDTLLRAVRRVVPEQVSTPQVLGVDDWALRRGQRYGTILCDLERHRPIDLLPERSSAQLRTWLTAHPGVQIVSRDRGDDYAKGASDGAPQARQVADRFHLLRNLHEALVRVVDRHHAQVVKAAKAADAKVSEALAHATETAATEPPLPPVSLTCAEQIKQANRARRKQRYQQVIALTQQGIAQRAVARQLGLHRSTVRRFLHAGCFPERAVRRYLRHTDTCVDELRRRWDAGCHNAAQLTRQLHEAGVTVSYHMVRRRVAPWRAPHEAHRTAGPKTAPSPPKTKRPSSNRVAWILAKDDSELPPEEQTLRAQLLTDCPELREATTLTQEFARLVRDRRAEDLDAWIALATAAGGSADLRRFARGLTADYAAVRAALTLPWSNGQVEGQINRLKLVKRQMYGRANFDLLRARFLNAG